MNTRAFIVIFLFIVFCIGCKPDSGNKKVDPELINNPVSATSTEDTSKIPVFEFETENHEFGSIKEGDVVSFDFKFRNAGKAPLIITQASASCGCTVPEYSKDPIAPAENGFIKVTFNSEGKHGMTSKTVTLLANTTPNTKVLTISADITKKDN
ncbi:MAG: DUF1573 domain-containing protein [Bacteroidetes bacterium]|nr:MAG: OmpA/MotB domain-containing protein [Bacteroidetes bacterium OLB10]MCE7954812.1 DUF1573 domain-containing protein [Bacteroidetes bacterium CHB6]MCO5289044.1 DUF1573 domain-containing protein [Bacteroidota bacterium]HRV53039.1 DUF1573 domain-containing protein [Bacteroidia bacterium]